MVSEQVGYQGEPLTVSEMVEYLRRRGFPATGDRLRQYQRAGFFPSIPHDKGDHRQYSAWQSLEVERVFALLELGFRRKEIKRYMDAWETMMREGSKLIRQKEPSTDEGRRAIVEALTGQSKLSGLQRLSIHVYYVHEMEEQIRQRARIRVERLQKVAEQGLRPGVEQMKERLEKEGVK